MHIGLWLQRDVGQFQIRFTHRVYCRDLQLDANTQALVSYSVIAEQPT